MIPYFGKIKLYFSSIRPWTFHVSIMIPERKYDDVFPLH